MSPRILIIHNPVAGRRHGRRLSELLGMLAAEGLEVEVKPTTGRGHARETARLAEGIDVIVAAGGDGTVNEIVDGLRAKPDGETLPSIGFLPLGTANVLAWELGLPRTPKALVRQIRQGRTLAVRPGIANGKRFVLMVSVGLDARAVAAVRGQVKRLLGGGAYVMAALRALRQPSPPCTVRIGNATFQARTVIVTRARRYGGPFVLAPDAGLETSALHIVMLQSSGLVATLRYGLALVMGRLHKLPDVVMSVADQVEIEGAAGDPVQMDGDVASVMPLSVSMDSRCVPFLVPERIYASARGEG